jgi:SPW repeat
MDRGPLPLRIHAAIEPLIGLVLILSPWTFGFSDANDAQAP